MPLAGDAYLKGGQLPAANNPLNRLQLGAFSNKIDPLQIIAQWTQFFEDYLNDIIKNVTGIDLSALGLLNPVTLLEQFTSAFEGIDLTNPGSILVVIENLVEEAIASIPGVGPLIDAIVNGLGVSGTGFGLSDVLGAFNGVFGGISLAGTNPLLSAIMGPIQSLINGVTGGTSNPLTSLISSLLGTASTASTANTNASTGLGNWTSLLGGIPGVSTVSGLLGFLQPTTSSSGIFAPLINGITGGTTNPLSSLLSNLLGTASTASTASTNSTTALSNFTSLINGVVGGTGNPLSALISSLTGTASTATSANSNASTALSNFTSLINGVVGGSGNPLSALISALTGTASTASTANTNASSALSNFTTLINGVVGGTGNPLSALITSLTGTASATSTNSTNLGSLITNLFGGSSILSQVQPGAVGGVTSGASLLTDVQTFLNNVFNGTTRTTGSTASQASTAAAVAGQADTVAGTSATMDQILAALGQGTPDSDDFERTSSSSLGANWSVTQTGSGTLATPNGHDANFSGSGNVEYVARKTDLTASTDHQTVSMTLATAIPSYPLFTPLPYGGNNDLWLRMTAFTTFATRTGLRFRINSQAPYQATWFIHWVTSGTETQLATGSLSIPSAGASIAFEVGVGGNNLAYQARVAGSPVANFTDSTARGLGTANRYRGFGGKGASGIGTNQGTANLTQWTAQG